MEILGHSPSDKPTMKSKQSNNSKEPRAASVKKIMRVKEDRQPLIGQERDGDPSGEEDRDEGDIVDNDEEEDTDDESIDIPPNPEHELNIERLRAENTMLRELAAQREVVRKEMEEYRGKLMKEINAMTNDVAHTEAVREEMEEYRRRLIKEINDMTSHLDSQKQMVAQSGSKNPSREEEPEDS